VRESGIRELNVEVWLVVCGLWAVGAKKMFCSSSVSCTQNITEKRYFLS